eukprot:4688436-Pyramimonas_sp.AAC.1
MGPRSAVLDVGAACGPPSTGAFGGAPYGATKRCPGRGSRMWPPSTGAFGGAPYGATKRCPGCGGRMQHPPLEPS